MSVDSDNQARNSTHGSQIEDPLPPSFIEDGSETNTVCFSNGQRGDNFSTHTPCAGDPMYSHEYIALAWRWGCPAKGNRFSVPLNKLRMNQPIWHSRVIDCVSIKVMDDPSRDTYLHFEGEVFLQIFDDHHQERQLDAERLLRIGRTSDVRSAYVGSDDLQHQRLDVLVRNPFDVPIAHFFVPNLERLGTDRVKHRQEPRLEGVFEHGRGRLDLRTFHEGFRRETERI